MKNHDSAYSNLILTPQLTCYKWAQWSILPVLMTFHIILISQSISRSINQMLQSKTQLLVSGKAFVMRIKNLIKTEQNKIMVLQPAAKRSRGAADTADSLMYTEVRAFENFRNWMLENYKQLNSSFLELASNSISQKRFRFLFADLKSTNCNSAQNWGEPYSTQAVILTHSKLCK